MAIAVSPATEQDLRRATQRGKRCELVDGQVREMTPAGGRHGQICGRVLTRLVIHVEARQLGVVFDSSTGFRMPSGNVRAPDVAFVSRERLPGDGVPAGFVPVVPDLAVEVRSPDDSPREVLDKIGEYLASGVRIVWLVDPEARTVVVHRTLSDIVSVSEDGVVSGGDVLPGFEMPLSKLF